jgi:hypothetical protein
MPATQSAKDFSKLLADVPHGAWVAISRDEERVVAYDAEFSEALRKAKQNGENDPIMMRVPDKNAVLFL